MTRSGADLALLLLGGYRRLVDDAIAELAVRGYDDVRPSHDFAMRAIDSGAHNASELGRRMSVSKQAALRTISVLIERGWVARQDDPEDRRRMKLAVTDAGHEVMSAGEAVFDDLRRAWEQELGRDELATLEKQLTRLVGEQPIRLDAPGWVSSDHT